MRPRSSITSNQSICRMVLAASSTALRVASAKLTGEVPTISTILYMSGIALFYDERRSTRAGEGAAAINAVSDAGDPGSLLRYEKGDQLGDLFWLCEAA